MDVAGSFFSKKYRTSTKCHPERSISQSLSRNAESKDLRFAH
jgi:hypothetical protein